MELHEYYAALEARDNTKIASIVDHEVTKVAADYAEVGRALARQLAGQKVAQEGAPEEVPPEADDEVAAAAEGAATGDEAAAGDAGGESEEAELARRTAEIAAMLQAGQAPMPGMDPAPAAPAAV